MIMLRGINNSVRRNEVESMRQKEAPEFDNGRLLRRKPIRHRIPNTNFYYTNSEWFNQTNKEKEPLPEIPKESKSLTAAAAPAAPEKPSKACTIQAPAPTQESSEEYQEYNQSEFSSKLYGDSYIRKDAAKWKSTPVPGIRTATNYDQYRNEAIKHYDCVYDKNRGVLPKYGGYVPGLKFRYGSTFGQLTYNAREIGCSKSRTWGGAVSLF